MTRLPMNSSPPPPPSLPPPPPQTPPLIVPPRRDFGAFITAVTRYFIDRFEDTLAFSAGGVSSVLWHGERFRSTDCITQFVNFFIAVILVQLLCVAGFALSIVLSLLVGPSTVLVACFVAGWQAATLTSGCLATSSARYVAPNRRYGRGPSFAARVAGALI